MVLALQTHSKEGAPLFLPHYKTGIEKIKTFGHDHKAPSPVPHKRNWWGTLRSCFIEMHKLLGLSAGKPQISIFIKPKSMPDTRNVPEICWMNEWIIEIREAPGPVLQGIVAWP